MDRKALSRISKIAILSVLFLCSCAGRARGPLVIKDRPLPDVRLSPEIILLDVPITRISAAIDQDGRAHVLASSSKPRALYHLVVGMEGVLDREVVPSFEFQERLDITFDASGNLHALVNEDHLVLENGTWRKLPKDPCKKLIRSGQDLFCAFQVEGKDIGVRGDWDVYCVTAGGPPGGACCFLFPLPHYPNKLVIARKTPAGWSEWTVCDPETRFEIVTFSIASDNSGTVHLLYNSVEGASFPSLQCAYARIQTRISEETSENRQIYHSDLVDVPCTLAKLSGQVITSESVVECHDIAVDPETGTALITVKKYQISTNPPQAYNYIYEDGEFAGGPIMMYDFDGIIHVEPAGDGLFVALGVWSDRVGPWSDRDSTDYIYYLEYRDGVWSAPLELANGRSDNVVFVSDLNQRAFALWANENDWPVARWIER